MDSGKGLLVPMVCPRSGHDLLAGPGDRIGLCPPCSRAFYLARGLEEYGLSYAKPEVMGRGKPRYLPFWRIAGRALISGNPKKLRAYPPLPKSGEMHFPAFWLPRLAYFEDLTMRYAMRERPVESEIRDEPAPGGVRDPKLLPEMARLALLAHYDRIADVGDVTLEFKAGETSLVGIPFYEEPGGWLEGISGALLPPALLSAI